MNILVPTDFSKCADNALDVACQVAILTNAELHIYHSADIPNDWEDLELSEKVNDTKNKYVAIEAREKLIARRDKAQEQGLKCTIHYTGGKLVSNIEEIFEKVLVDLIVMGSHGIGGKEEWFIGSNTQKVIRKYHKDVLVIKEPAPIFAPKSAVFISSLHIEDQEAFMSFLDYTDALGIEEVHVLTIDTSSWFSQPTFLIRETQKDFIKIAEGRKCKAHFYRNHSVQYGISDFMKENNIDLAGISYRTRHPLKRIFMGSNVEMLINRTDKPVLCINSYTAPPIEE